MVLRAPEVLFLCICGVVPGRRGCCLDPGVLRVTAIAEMQHARELQEEVAGAGCGGSCSAHGYWQTVMQRSDMNVMR